MLPVAAAEVLRDSQTTRANLSGGSSRLKDPEPRECSGDHRPKGNHKRAPEQPPRFTVPWLNMSAALCLFEGWRTRGRS